MTEAPPIDWDDLEAAPAPPRQVNGHQHRDQVAVDAERAVLGAALLQPGLVPELAGILRDDDWALPAHETIWHAISDRVATGKPVDPGLIAADIGTDRTLAGHGGPLYLHELIADPALAVSNAPWHAGIVTARAADRRDEALGTWLQQAARSGTDPDQRRTRLEQHLADRNPAGCSTHSPWGALDLTDALNGIEETPPALMPRNDGHCLLYPGAVHTISGEPGTGKTWIALHAALHELQQGHQVALLDFEDRPARVVARFLRLGATPRQIADQLRYVRPNAALDTAGRAALTLAVTDTTLCILDGVTEAMSLHGLDLGKNPDVATFYTLLPRWIADHGPTVLLIDHVVKDGEKQGRWGIGGQHKLAGVDGAAYTIKAVQPFGRGKAGHSRVLIAKDRHGHVEEHALGRCAAEFHLDSTDPDISRATLEPPEQMPTTDSGDHRPTFLMERVSRYVEINPGETSNGIVSAKLGKAQYVREAIAALVTEGYLEVRPGARNATHHHSIEPFRRAEGDPDATTN